MENRKRNIQMKFYVTEEEKRLIDEKMKQLPIKQYGAYFRKMAIVLDFLQHFRDGLHEQVRVDDVWGMALGVFGFPLVILAAIGNMPLAAVPVIYADVHFCAAILTEKQARQRVDFPVPGLSCRK